MSMLSMYGPNTNWSVLQKLTDHRVKDEFPKLFDVGSCGLHSIHGSFPTGVKSTESELAKVLKGMWKLFNDSPARRDTYIKLNRTDQFPRMFCQTRWVGDEPVASRAMSVWPFVVAVIEHFQTLPPSKQPRDNKSYDILVKYHKDCTMLFKFQFFIDIANVLSPFLKQFQTDDPVMPFMSGTLDKMIRQLMKKFILSSVVIEALTLYQLVMIDVRNKDSCLPYNAAKLPTASKTILSSLKIPKTMQLRLIKECVLMLQSTVVKLQERSALKYLIVRCSSSLVPQNILNDEDAVILNFNKIVDKLFQHKPLNNIEADNAKLQFEDYVTYLTMLHADEFNTFDMSIQRLVRFYGNFLHKN